MTYKPNTRSREILARAWEHVRSVPYQVTARWLFYALLQEGYYSGKNDYNYKFLPLLSRARKRFYEGWRPDTLVDDRRDAIVRGVGYDTPSDWAQAMAERGACTLHRWEGQDYYVELWFEAESMAAQFRHYTRGIILRPFSGDPSLHYKWEAAKALERAQQNYALAIKVLYFGDLDPKGEQIPESAVHDIRAWCGVDFEFIRAGLNHGDEIKYNIPENFEHPGAYQWVGLNDAAARELITDAVAQYVNLDAMKERAELEHMATLAFRRHMADFEPNGSD